MNAVKYIAGALVVVGGLNWGLVAIAEFDLVAWLVGEEFGTTNAISRIVYGLVGLSAVVLAASAAADRSHAPASPAPPAVTRERGRTMRKLTFPLTAAVLIVIAATAAIATAGDDERTTATKPTTAQSQTIVEIAAGDKRFDTLVELVKSAGLAETLSGDGPFTVFAPTDKAFRKVPRRTLRALGRDRAALRRVLLPRGERELRGR